MARPWLDAHHDALAGVSAFSQHMALVDMQGNGDCSLVVASLDRKLKVFRSLALVESADLPDVPTSLCGWVSDDSGVPTLAVACGRCVYMYRSMRPFYKFTPPPAKIEAEESALWAQLKKRSDDDAPSAEEEAAATLAALIELRSGGAPLSSRSIDFLALEDGAARQAFIDQNRAKKLVQRAVVTCLAVLPKTPGSALGCIVVGTESRQLHILHPSGTSILKTLVLEGVPATISVSGEYDVDYRIAVGCRQCRVFFVRNGKVVGIVLEIETPPVAVRMSSDGKEVYVAEMGGMLHLFSTKGDKQWSIFAQTEDVSVSVSVSESESESESESNRKRACTITAIAVFDSPPHNVKGLVLVALAGGDVRMYRGQRLVGTIATTGERAKGGAVSGLIHGRYGRQGGVLIMAHRCGALSVKMLRRTANLDGVALDATRAAHDVPLSLPKKTRLYVDMTQREREHAAEMHHLFQRDLLRLRLTTARAYVKLLDAGDARLVPRNGVSVNLTVAVQVRACGCRARSRSRARMLTHCYPRRIHTRTPLPPSRASDLRSRCSCVSQTAAPQRCAASQLLSRTTQRSSECQLRSLSSLSCCQEAWAPSTRRWSRSTRRGERALCEQLSATQAVAPPSSPRTSRFRSPSRRWMQ